MAEDVSTVSHNHFKKYQEVLQENFFSSWCLGKLVECGLVLYGTSEHPYKRHEQPRSAEMSKDDDTEEYNSAFCLRSI